MANAFAKKDNKVNFVRKKQVHVIMMINIVVIMELAPLENVFAKIVSLEINVTNKLMIQTVKETIKKSRTENAHVKMASMALLVIRLILSVRMIPVKMEDHVPLMDANAQNH